MLPWKTRRAHACCHWFNTRGTPRSSRINMPTGRARAPLPTLRRIARRLQLPGLILEHLRLLLLARRRLHGDAVAAWDDMDMEVEHDLAAGRLVELLDRHAVGAEHFYRRPGHLLRHLGDMGEVVGRDVEDV